MKIYFHISYRAQWGESLHLVDASSHRGAGFQSIQMECSGYDSWSAELLLPDECGEFAYRYEVRRDDGGVVAAEWGVPHRFRTAVGATVYRIEDRWQDLPADKPYYSTAFTECIHGRGHSTSEPVLAGGMTVLRVMAPTVGSDEVLAVVGGHEELGLWNPEQAVVMSDAGFPEWEVALNLNPSALPVEYKFVVLKKDGRLVAWEGGGNRLLGGSATSPSECVVEAGMRFVEPRPRWRGAGVAVPVFALRSDEDYGVGDFYDLKLLVDWAAATGQTFIQILPINDTTMTHTWTDSYPYNANSTFALHPMYLRLSELGRLTDSTRQEEFEKIGRELNELPVIDYERVNKAKTEFARAIFEQDGGETVESDEYKKFVESNKEWLMPYAAYCTLRDLNGSADFSTWGDYAEYSPSKVARLRDEHSALFDFACYIQFHLARQMRNVTEYAHSKGVAIKGDIPIGISRTSVDAWLSPRLFNLDCQAGAPPDDFSVLGQNWGFPTYNWEEMNRDGFRWWKSRFRSMAQFFDAYRIDHVLGFFRIWQIPMSQIHGLLGVFNPALPFSPEELRMSYDFWINPEVHTRPFIREYMLHDFFGEYADEVRGDYLVDDGDGRYSLRPEFATQRQVADRFAAMEKNEKNELICNALMGLIDDVLFVEDPYEKGKYHPRISAHYTYVYRSLNDYEKWCFNRLYDDFYYHRHNDFWYGKAMWKLPPLIDATGMLVCAEDLGMIPACVPAVMSNLEILSLEIQRMPKDPTTPFGNTWSYPYLSVCTTSTHDMSGIRQWWEEDREATQRFYNEVLHEGGAAPYYAEPWICEKIIDLHLDSPSMLAILPLQDWLSMDAELRREDPREERINVPANSRHYWRYRMHLTLERLLSASEFNERMRAKIVGSAR